MASGESGGTSDALRSAEGWGEPTRSTRLGGPGGEAASGSADDSLERDGALDPRGDRAGEVPAQLGRADPVLGGGEDAPLGPLGAAGDVAEPGQEAVDD